MHVDKAESPGEGYVLGEALYVEEGSYNRLMVDKHGPLVYYLGFEATDSQSLSHYGVGVGLRRKETRDSCSFIELRQGKLIKTSYLGKKDWYKVVNDCWVILPAGTQNYYGVIDRESRSENSELTRQLFGATLREVESVAHAVGRMIGRSYGPDSRMPRVTFSKSRDNACDLTGAHIPQGFPYVAFAEAQYEWSHVSLFGLYRFLSMVAGTQDRSAVHGYLTEAGVDPTVLRRMIDAADGVPWVWHRPTW